MVIVILHFNKIVGLYKCANQIAFLYAFILNKITDKTD